jgi:hypothetical protein
MSLLGDVKAAMRIGHNALDDLIGRNIVGAIADMENKGVSARWLGTDAVATPITLDDVDEDRLPSAAFGPIVSYVMVHTLLDFDEREDFMQIYESQVCTLLNGPMNSVYEE